MPSRAQLTQDRSRQRREELLAAAISLFAEGGGRAVTHRAVASRAGLPPATTTYYFASIDELLREALRGHIVAWRAELDALAGVGDVPAGPARIQDLTEILAAVFSVRRPEVAGLHLAIYLAATADEALREEAASAVRVFETLLGRWLDRLGVPEPDPLAASLVVHVVGGALRRQSGRYSEAEEAASTAVALCGLVAAHLVGTEGVDELLATLVRPDA